MNRPLLYLCVFFTNLFSLGLSAQERNPSVVPSSFYIGVHAGMPLFWGDVRSAGERFHPGYGGGLSFGYRLTPWLSAEIDTDFMSGRMGAAKWQVDDRMNEQGLIDYTQGVYRLGDIYSQTNLFRVGMSLPVEPLSLMGIKGAFQLALAPHFYVGRFDPRIYRISNGEQVSAGTDARSLSHSMGLDFGLSYKTGKNISLLFRTSGSWLHDDRFDGLLTRPAWRENFLLYTTFGVRFDLIKTRTD